VGRAAVRCRELGNTQEQDEEDGETLLLEQVDQAAERLCIRALQSSLE
jgi:hypothetical protein